MSPCSLGSPISRYLGLFPIKCKSISLTIDIWYLRVIFASLSIKSLSPPFFFYKENFQALSLKLEFLQSLNC